MAGVGADYAESCLLKQAKRQGCGEFTRHSPELGIVPQIVQARRRIRSAWPLNPCIAPQPVESAFHQLGSQRRPMTRKKEERLWGMALRFALFLVIQRVPDSAAAQGQFYGLLVSHDVPVIMRGCIAATTRHASCTRRVCFCGWGTKPWHPTGAAGLAECKCMAQTVPAGPAIPSGAARR